MVLDPQVAMTGPVGYSENPNLPNLLSAQSWNEPTVVHELQGAIFCVRSRLFQDGTFYFDPYLTPAFSEEFDLAKQFEKNGSYKIVMVPTDNYSHGGSGSHKGLATIKYFDTQSAKISIMARNIDYVWQKWQNL